MSDSKVREHFGVWYREQPIGSLTRAWDAWQASRAAALEEAEELCRMAAERFAHRTLASTLARNLADGIRALAGRGA